MLVVNRTIPEGAGVGATVGSPVTASTANPLIEIRYTLHDNVGGLFSVGSCTGQIVVMQSGRIDYETQKFYQLKVDAIPNGVTASKTTITVGVSVLDRNDAPVLMGADALGGSSTRLVSEDATAGVSVGAPLNVTDPEGDVLSFRLVVGGGP